MHTDLAVQAQSLVKTYAGGVEAVRGISFDVHRGEAFGLLGPNGAGKTTTIGMLTTAVTPTSGRALLAGRDVARDPLGTRAISSVVFQDPVVDAPLTGRQNLELHARLWGVPRQSGKQRLEALSATVGLDGILDRPVSTYSGGERRRLEIVRALLSSPQVLFLDEPTVGLDTRVRHDLFDVITTLRESTGVTVILTTHYLDEAERLCDRIAVVDSGTLVACDTPAALLGAMGPEVLELRVDRPELPARILEEAGVPGGDSSVVGSTVVVSLRAVTVEEVTRALEGVGVLVMSATRRGPTLDDVYLRLTGAHIAASDT
jgi:ABC-2 type transport system ATP-binding protein